MGRGSGKASALLGLVVVVVAAVIAFALARWAWRVLEETESDAAVAAIAGSFAVIGSTVTVVWSRRQDRHMAEREALRESKTKIYEEFMGFWFRVLFAQQLGESEPDDAETQRWFVTFSQEATAWASDGFVREYAALRQRIAGRRAAEASPAERAEWVVYFERVLKEIRVDLGHRNKGFKEGTLLGLFINDIDDEIARLRGRLRD